MTRHVTMTVPAGIWTQVTANDVTALTISNLGNVGVEIIGTADGIAPTASIAPVLLRPRETILSNVPLAVLWPGIAAKRVWVRAATECEVGVSHA